MLAGQQHMWNTLSILVDFDLIWCVSSILKSQKHLTPLVTPFLFVATHWALRSHSIHRFLSSSSPPQGWPWSAPAQCCSRQHVGPLWRPDSTPPPCCSEALRSSCRRGRREKRGRQKKTRTTTVEEKKERVERWDRSSQKRRGGGLTVKARLSVILGVRKEVRRKWPRQ